MRFFGVSSLVKGAYPQNSHVLYCHNYIKVAVFCCFVLFCCCCCSWSCSCFIPFFVFGSCLKLNVSGLLRLVFRPFFGEASTGSTSSPAGRGLTIPNSQFLHDCARSLCSQSNLPGPLEPWVPSQLTRPTSQWMYAFDLKHGSLKSNMLWGHNAA